MSTERISTRRVLPISVSLLVFSAVGCTRVGTVSDPRAFMLDRPASHIWVTGPDNRLVELKHARVLDDTLSGFDGSSYYEVAVSDVKRLQARVPDHGATTLAVGGAAVVVGGVLYLLTSTGAHAGACGTWVGQTLCYPGGPICSQGVWTPCAPSTSRNEW
jgi:hypothetical protein